jgi:LAGLIDADG DNA endonuclease family
MDKQQLNNDFRKNQLKIKKKWEKSGIKISKELRDIIHGYVMSDGSIRNGVLSVDQNIKQKRFVLWLYDHFKPIRTSSPIKEITRSHPKTKTKTRSLRFFTCAVLNGFYYMWYKHTVDNKGLIKYQKKLPKNINCFFNETFISVWFAGDGTKIIGSLGAKFEVTSFCVEDRLKLKQLFLMKYGIKTQIILSGKSKKGTVQWALKIPANEYSTFRDLITKRDLIPNLFPYKLHKKNNF